MGATHQAPKGAAKSKRKAKPTTRELIGRVTDARNIELSKAHARLQSTILDIHARATDLIARLEVQGGARDMETLEKIRAFCGEGKEGEKK